ncbi:methyltransferase domain-containing protein [Aurantiacibacter rhizosphaerae]|nr:methyltransferase domain-containing protein [Aurantiacibacter rhizosphaerae]
MLGLQEREQDAARFVLDDMVEDIAERLAFVRHDPARALVIGDYSGNLARHSLGKAQDIQEADIVGNHVIDLQQPHPAGGHDFIAVLGLLDTVNDLPGALIHLRQALAPGGLVIAMFPGAGSLPKLRKAIYAAEPDRPAARMHPLVDTRAAADLLQRAGWKDPVVDSHDLNVRYGSLDRLVADLREQGLGNVLSSAAPPLTCAGIDRARAAFLDQADEDGRVTETFSILTLSGRRSLAGT